MFSKMTNYMTYNKTNKTHLFIKGLHYENSEYCRV